MLGIYRTSFSWLCVVAELVFTEPDTDFFLCFL